MGKLEKEFVPYNESRQLVNLGFDETCFTFYTEEKELYESEGCEYNQGKNVLGDEIIAPLYQQVFRWFREKHKLYAYPDIGEDDRFFVSISERGVYGDFATHEEAELECLQKLIEIVKSK